MPERQDTSRQDIEPSGRQYLTSPPPSSEMPPGIPYIVGNEAAERFSYYGIIAAIAIFLTGHLRDAAGNLAPMDEHLAREWQHNFMAAVYFFPIVGAILSDWLFGKYRMIIAVQLLYCVGPCRVGAHGLSAADGHRSEGLAVRSVSRSSPSAPAASSPASRRMSAISSASRISI